MIRSFIISNGQSPQPSIPRARHKHQASCDAGVGVDVVHCVQHVDGFNLCVWRKCGNSRNLACWSIVTVGSLKQLNGDRSISVVWVEQMAGTTNKTNKKHSKLLYGPGLHLLPFAIVLL